MKKAIVGIIVIVIACVVGIYAYTSSVSKSNFDIKEISGSGEEILWTDNSEHNKYDIKFGTLNGSDLKEIDSKKNTYDMKIDSNVTSGSLHLKIYNNKKVLFEKSGSINTTITVGKNDSKNLKVEITGKKAGGHVKIGLS